MIKSWLKKRRKKKLLLNATTYAVYLMTQNVRPKKALQLAKERYKVPIEDIIMTARNCMSNDINEYY